MNVLDPSWQTGLHPSWLPVLSPHAELITELVELPNSLPARNDVLRVFRQPLDAVKVVILGQDPYPTPGHAMGLSFSVAPGVKPPRSLVNIFRELHTDLGVEPAQTGDLSPWVNEGVMLLNTVLTVEAGKAGSHRGKGWEEVTESALKALVARHHPLVAILWGAQAARYQQLFEQSRDDDDPRDAQRHRYQHQKILVLCSAHPSPLSARRGFFGSKPFSKTNRFLEQQGLDPIDWRLPSPDQPPLISL